VRPDIRPQLREYLAWYEEVLGRIEAGALMAPGEQERLTEEASAVAHLLDLLDSSADEPVSETRYKT
jgi:surfactin synthase thioesterase subunit